MTVPEDDFVYTYCIELLLEGGPACVNQLRNNLQVYGGSLIVGNIDELIKVHVHSNHPGQVLEYCQQHGSLHDIKINNMRDQWKQAYGAAAGRPDAFAAPAAATDAQEVGVVAVAAGEGIREIFRSLGAAQIIDGGQTMNPPVKEFVRAIEAMPQTQVLVLPNNKNLILAAEQAKGLVGRRVEIIATTGIQAGIAALLSFNPAQGLTANMERMEQAANRIKSAEVTYAVRDAVVQGAAIKQGSLIGLWQDEIVAVGTSLEQVVLLLVDQMLGDHDELVTLFVGEGVAQDEAGAIAAAIRTRHPGVTVEVQPGGQPVYHFLISVE